MSFVCINIDFQSYGTPLPAQSIVSLIIWFLCLLYASIRTSSNTSLGKITGGGSGASGEEIPLSESRDTLAGETSKIYLILEIVIRNFTLDIR